MAWVMMAGNILLFENDVGYSFVASTAKQTKSERIRKKLHFVTGGYLLWEPMDIPACDAS